MGNLVNLNILIVEDEENLGNTLYEYLSTKGFSCHLTSNFESARNYFYENNVQIVLMDIGLPDGSGLELAKVMRNHKKNFVLLFLSAQNDPETRLNGLELGAEDFITKPFDLRELILRLNRIIETSNKLNNKAPVTQLGPLKIHFNSYEVVDGNKNIINLGQKECAILEVLFEKIGQVVSRDELLEKVWGESVFPSNRTVDNYIVKLRKWTDTSDEVVKISSIRGIGYKLEIKEQK